MLLARAFATGVPKYEDAELSLWLSLSSVAPTLLMSFELCDMFLRFDGRKVFGKSSTSEISPEEVLKPELSWLKCSIDVA